MFTYTIAHNENFNVINRTCKAFTVGEMSGSMWSGVFCAYKPYFLIPGHILETQMWNK